MNTLVKRNRFNPATALFEDFPNRSLFDWLEDAGIGRTRESNTLPRVNISETENDFRVEMAVPGLKKEDFKVELYNNTLTIEAEVSENSEEHNQNRGYTRKEFSYRAFTRSFYLPNTVENDKIEAKYQEGILRLVIPKREEARKKPARTIQIT
ncbi:Hsp20/alpha crystallin family protein [Algoriphagus persicinus]|uniref:Hsp20/alpha crystallin family protein n=1 Tax=Algoriphagus persicinus TaxID=3108754 RepID=UPI002B3B2ED8|nr:Hsp20/alpha crystallin family protein [Algoriphagus sp. E1-3-M2]MEB2786985.1 Hsp20/alpha crystallin family protein [Algoriphagus sp. E1-3-M2]